ncbi:MAG: hypothetical protein RLZZ422_650 [Pseudomonadota bacterium]|jgi:uncharacterized protein YaaW (UPF0174 family)
MAKTIKNLIGLIGGTLDFISNSSETLNNSLRDINLSLTIQIEAEELFRKKHEDVINKKLELKIQENLLDFHLEYEIPSKIENGKVVNMDYQNKNIALMETRRYLSKVKKELDELEKLTEILKKYCEMEVKLKYNTHLSD